MTEILKGYMDQIKPVSNVPLQLPKLKKKDSQSGLPQLNLPKLKKENSSPELPKLKLPKLNKIN